MRLVSLSLVCAQSYSYFGACARVTGCRRPCILVHGLSVRRRQYHHPLPFLPTRPSSPLVHHLLLLVRRHHLTGVFLWYVACGHGVAACTMNAVVGRSRKRRQDGGGRSSTRPAFDSRLLSFLAQNQFLSLFLLFSRFFFFFFSSAPNKQKAPRSATGKHRRGKRPRAAGRGQRKRWRIEIVDEGRECTMIQ